MSSTEWAAAGESMAGPLFDALRRELDFLKNFPDVAALNDLAIRYAPPGGAEIRRPHFVEPGRGVKGLSVVDNGYEMRVHLESAVETRPGNWHDMFNALVWLAWPRSKATLNAVHVREIQNEFARKAARRGVARDIATLFDEGGAVLASSDPALTGLVRDFKWHELFCARRNDVQSRMRCYIFGHALFDKALKPYKQMTAHALIFPVAPDFFRKTPILQIRALDLMLADWFGSPANLDSTRRLAPLPVFGFPGFCDANTDPRFFDDPSVFRPGRLRIVRP